MCNHLLVALLQRIAIANLFIPIPGQVFFKTLSVVSLRNTYHQWERALRKAGSILSRFKDRVLTVSHKNSLKHVTFSFHIFFYLPSLRTRAHTRFMIYPLYFTGPYLSSSYLNMDWIHPHTRMATGTFYLPLPYSFTFHVTCNWPLELHAGRYFILRDPASILTSHS